jgi:hypothetical protein
MISGGKLFVVKLGDAFPLNTIDKFLAINLHKIDECPNQTSMFYFDQVGAGLFS